MTGKKKKGKDISIVRSSAAEYLTFVAASGTGGVEAVYADESIWLTQKMMGVLYDVETHTVNYHLKRCSLTVSCRNRQLFEIFE